MQPHKSQRHDRRGANAVPGRSCAARGRSRWLVSSSLVAAVCFHVLPQPGKFCAAHQAFDAAPVQVNPFFQAGDETPSGPASTTESRKPVLPEARAQEQKSIAVLGLPRVRSESSTTTRLPGPNASMLRINDRQTVQSPLSASVNTPALPNVFQEPSQTTTPSAPKSTDQRLGSNRLTDLKPSQALPNHRRTDPLVSVEHMLRRVQGDLEAHRDQSRPSVNTSKNSQTHVENGTGETVARTWLASGTVESKRTDAQEKLAAATRDYGAKAWACAEASAWNAIRDACESIDRLRESSKVTSPSTTTAMDALQRSRDALREAEHFYGPYASDDPEVIRRLIRSHRTSLLQSIATDRPIARAEAADRYLNEARQNLGQISARSLEVAQALDLLAAIQLARPETRPLKKALALCYRRAAIQGQPNNAVLAQQLGTQLNEMGLHEEARWALEHARTLQASMPQIVPSGQQSLLPQVVQVSPQSFAQWSRPPSGMVAGSKPVSPMTVSPQAGPIIQQQVPMMASRPPAYQPVPSAPMNQGGSNEPSRGNPFQRMLDSIGQLW